VKPKASSRHDHRRDPEGDEGSLSGNCRSTAAQGGHAAAEEGQPRVDRSKLFDERFLKTLEHLHMVSRKVFSGNCAPSAAPARSARASSSPITGTYARGDDFRYIDWNLYGRLDKLLLRLFEEEEDLHIYILVDVSDSMAIGTPLPKLHYAMQVGAGADRTSGSRTSTASRSSRSRQADRPAAAVARQEPHLPRVRVPAQLRHRRQDRARRVHEGLRRAEQAARARGRDLRLLRPEGLRAGLNTLRYNKFEPFVLQVYDKREADPQLPRRSSRSSTARPATPARSRSRARCSRRTSASHESTARSSRRTAQVRDAVLPHAHRRSRSTSSC
jgi:hypothetical protein